MLKIPDNLMQALREAGDQKVDKIVCKVFNPCGGQTWLLTSLDPEDDNILWGFCDLGMGCVEYGTVYLSDLLNHRGPLGIGLEIDKFIDCDRIDIEALWDLDSLSNIPMKDAA